MNTEERIALIEEKQKEIEKLKKELKELKTEDQPFYKRMDEKPIRGVRYFTENNTYMIRPANGSNNYDAWEYLRRLACTMFFRIQHEFSGGIICDCAYTRQKELTEAEKNAAVDFLNEVIPIYNKHVRRANPHILHKGRIIELWGDE